MAEATKDVNSVLDGLEPAVRATYECILRELDRIGPFSEELREDTIHLAHSVTFASVQPHRSHLILTLRLDHPVESDRVHRIEQVSASRWQVEFKLNDPGDVDNVVRVLLVEAMELV